MTCTHESERLEYIKALLCRATRFSFDCIPNRRGRVLGSSNPAEFEWVAIHIYHSRCHHGVRRRGIPVAEIPYRRQSPRTREALTSSARTLLAAFVSSICVCKDYVFIHRNTQRPHHAHRKRFIPAPCTRSDSVFGLTVCE